jgi:hypothetical protein
VQINRKAAQQHLRTARYVTAGALLGTALSGLLAHYTGVGAELSPQRQDLWGAGLGGVITLLLAHYHAV